MLKGINARLISNVKIKTEAAKFPPTSPAMDSRIQPRGLLIMLNRVCIEKDHSFQKGKGALSFFLLFRHRVISALTQWIATNNSAYCQKATLYCTVSFYRFNSISGAGRIKTATGYLCRRNVFLIKSDKPYKHITYRIHFRTILVQPSAAFLGLRQPRCF